MVKRQMYQKIQRYKAQGYSRKRIALELNLDRGTVRKYYDMPEESYRHYLLVRGERKKTAEEYQADILEVYQANQNRRLNMAAVYDYLEEKYGELAFSEKTLRNYITYLVEKGLLTLKERVRTFMKVPELPWGSQMQLDFGEYRCTSGLKLYIFAALLSTSRCKFVCLQDRPFTTLDVIQLLLDCFRFYGGQPHEIVIDQDKLMVVSENQGDIVDLGHVFCGESMFSLTSLVPGSLTIWLQPIKAWLHGWKDGPTGRFPNRPSGFQPKTWKQKENTCFPFATLFSVNIRFAAVKSGRPMRSAT